MICLSQNELVELALEQTDNERSSAHLESCADCRSRLETVRSLVDDLKQYHHLPHEHHQAARTRLLEAIAREEPVVEVALFRRITHWIGELTMRQRIALLTASLAPVLGFLVFWTTMIASPVAALERMTKQILEAKSYQATMIQEMKWVPEPGQDPVEGIVKCEMYWKTPGMFRWEMEPASDKRFTHSSTTKIFFTHKAGIELNQENKSFERVPAYQGQMSPLMILHQLGKFEGEADRQLGKQKIGEIETVGFELDARKIDPDVYSGPMQIWLDQTSQLPVLIELTMPTGGIDLKIRFENIRWNLDLDPTLFDVTPPQGFTDKTPPAPKTEEQVEQIAAALKTYAEIMGGHYPRVKMVYGDVTHDDLRKKIGIAGIPTKEQLSSPEYGKIEDAVSGFATLNVILRENPDAVWNGLTVGPQDEGKVLFRWKLDDGSYQVIFGNLKSENVTPDRLKELETK